MSQNKITGSLPRLALHTMVLLALMLLGYNGYVLMTIISPPVAGLSEEFKSASEKWRRLEKKMQTTASKFKLDYDLDAALLKASVAVQGSESQSQLISSAPENIIQKEKIYLPTLSGILRHSTIGGQTSEYAIINGRRYRENDKCMGFRILSIKEDGVVISRERRTWKLVAPEVSYSHVVASKPLGQGSDSNK